MLYNDIIKCYRRCKKRGLIDDINKCLTFSDKIKWIGIYGVSDLKKKLCDKLLVRLYCNKILGVDLFPKIIRVYENTKEIDLDKLTYPCILKCTHGSGFNQIIKNKNDVNLDLLNEWLNKDYSFKHGELQYYNSDKKIIEEEYLCDNVMDLKIYCFNGEPKLIDVYKDRRSEDGLRVNSYDLNFNLIKNVRKEENIKEEIKKPSNLNEMIDISKKLSSEFDFVRVDFFYANDKFYLAELTFTPAAGNQKFNKEYDLIFGKILKLKNYD